MRIASGCNEIYVTNGNRAQIVPHVDVSRFFTLSRLELLYVCQSEFGVTVPLNAKVKMNESVSGVK